MLVEHALTGDSHVVGEAGPGHAPGLVERPHRPGRPGRPRRVVRHRLQRARRLPGQHRARASAPRTGVPGAAGSRSSPSATRWRPRLALADALGIRAVARRRRWVDGRHAGARVGGRRTPTASSRSRARLARRTPPPTRSPGASRSCSPSGTTRSSAVATTTTSDARPRHRPGHRAADRPHDLPHRDRARRPLRPRRRSSARTRSGGRGRFAVESYLDHHAGKLARRFDAELLRRADRGDEHPRRGSRTAAGSQAALGRVTRRLHHRRRSTPTGSTRRACPTSCTPPCRGRSARTSTPTSATTASSSRRSRWAASSRPLRLRRRSRPTGAACRVASARDGSTPHWLFRPKEVREVAIVVGYVATKEGRAALKRAAEECVLRGAKLVVISSHRGGKDFDANEARPVRDRARPGAGRSSRRRGSSTRCASSSGATTPPRTSSPSPRRRRPTSSSSACAAAARSASSSSGPTRSGSCSTRAVRSWRSRATDALSGTRRGGPHGPVGRSRRARVRVAFAQKASCRFIMSEYRIARGAPRARDRDRLRQATPFRHQTPFSSL